jgi:hypothetical protein
MEDRARHLKAHCDTMLKGLNGMLGEVVDMQNKALEKMTPEEKLQFATTMKKSGAHDAIKEAKEKLNSAQKK